MDSLIKLCSLFLFLLFLSISKASNTLNPGDILSVNDTLVSPLGVFEFGFFPAKNSPNHYLGIWFKNDKQKKPIWVSNPDTPLLQSSPVLYLTNDGNLATSGPTGEETVITTKRDPQSINVTACQLLDTGNLVLIEGEKTVWQSFDSPTDTFLPGMKLGWFDMDKKHVRKQFLTSWITPWDPSRGNFLFGSETGNETHFRIWRQNDNSYKDVGFWNVETKAFEFFFATNLNDYNFTFVSNNREIYLTYSKFGSGSNPVPWSWFELASSGHFDEVAMFGRGISVWNHSLMASPLGCGNGDGFSEVKGAVLGSETVSFAARLGLSDCEITCKNNCSCTAYSYAFDGDECLLYFGDKNEFRRGNQSIFVRDDARINSDHQRMRNLLLKILVPISSLIMLILIFSLCYFLWRRKSNRIGIDMSTSGLRKSVRLFSALFSSNTESKDKARNVQQLFGDERHELSLLSFSTISNATDNFSFRNKLGEGGFGPVYKGKLLDHDIAVKRLSKSSGQGFEEFENEVKLISELQHRNLVKLLGYCIYQEEKILIYEYMANKSLDSFIFDRKRATLLNWDQRMRIIEGIAQGLLYLHKYSRLRVIHRDLKTSNILLDANMNPKISDFGMARICQENECLGVTRRVVGTYGYMSPEYATNGYFSTKSDVFSYGVILLEILSGRKNTSTFEYMNHSLSLLGYSWNLWKDDRGSEIIDTNLTSSCRVNEVQLCLHVALLCVQENPEHRPAMSEVVSMLVNERNFLCAPSQPALSTYLSLGEIDSPKMVRKTSHGNVSFSALEAR